MANIHILQVIKLGFLFVTATPTQQQQRNKDIEQSSSHPRPSTTVFILLSSLHNPQYQPMHSSQTLIT